MPTAALADEILLDGEGQVKALICIGGNPMAAWPDQRKTLRALESLDLLVTLDTEMSLTSRLADYVIAPMMQMETPAMTQGSELLKYYTTGIGIPAAYAQYAPRLVDPPAGSDLIEEWQFFLGLAKRMDLELSFVNFFGGGGGRFMESPPVVVNINGDTELTTEELFAADVRDVAHPARRGHAATRTARSSTSTPWSRNVTPTAPPGSTSATPTCSTSSPRSLAEDFHGRDAMPRIPFRLIPRRHGNFMNSSGTNLAELNRGKPYNPVYMHPDAIAALGLESGRPGDGHARPTTASPASSRPTTPCDSTSSPCITPSAACPPRTVRSANGAATSDGCPHRRRLRPDHRHAAQGNIPVRVTAGLTRLKSDRNVEYGCERKAVGKRTAYRQHKLWVDKRAHVTSGPTRRVVR